MIQSKDSHSAMRGLWKSPIQAEHLAESAQVLEPKFTTDGTSLFFVRSSDGVDHLWEFGSESECSFRKLQQVTTVDSLKGNALYGGGTYSCGKSSTTTPIIFISGKEKGLQYLNHETVEMNRLFPMNLMAACPNESLKGILAFTAVFEEEMRMCIADVTTKEWPRPLPPRTDFAIDPSWSRDGKYLAWHAWNFPYMAWDESFIIITEIQHQSSKHQRILHQESTSMGQPRWSPRKNKLAFLWDRNGWYNLWALNGIGEDPEPLLLEEAEHGLPTWVCGLQNFDWLADGNSIVSIRNKDAQIELIKIDVDNKESTALPFPKGWYQSITAHPKKMLLAAIYSSPTTPEQLQLLDLTKETITTIYQSVPLFPTKYLAKPRHVSFPTTFGEKAHALLHALEWESLENAPVIVSVHGGPTSQRGFRWNETAHFFASRGYLYAELNYRGSTGYGRAYAQRLNGNWGILDTDDAHSLLRYLEKMGWADPSRSAIMGGSAGGFLVLNTLIKYPDAFTCGIDLYGVTDLIHLARHTHYFESRYLDQLIGPLPEAADKYRERSPIYHAENIQSALLILQGAEDVVVPRAQSESIVKTLESLGKTVKYKLYQGEGHGFRKKSTIIDAYNEILSFLDQQLLYRS